MRLTKGRWGEQEGGKEGVEGEEEEIKRRAHDR